MILLEFVAVAAAKCADVAWWDEPEVVTTSGLTLPQGAAPWVVWRRGERRELTLRTEADRRVLVRRVGEDRIELVPWFPLRAGATYSIDASGERFPFRVEETRDTTPPSGGALLAWTEAAALTMEGLMADLPIAVQPFDEPAWFEAELWRADGEPVHVIDRVLQPSGEGPLRLDRFQAEFPPDIAAALGARPEAVIPVQLAAVPAWHR